MNRQIKGVLGLSLAVFLAAPVLAQQKQGGGPDGGKSGASAAGADDKELDMRVQFDKETAKGEVKCSQGKLKDRAVEYGKCAQDKLDKYDGVAIEKKIIASKEKYDALEAKKKKLANKLAFYDSAHKQLKKDIEELGEAKKEEIAYKKKVGALKKIDKEFDKSISECGKEDKAVFACPTKE